MNLRQPFEQFIAGKLRQLPAPDADASWQQMKRLLDEDEDRGGGGKRPPGNGQWWRIGMIAFVLLCSTWLFVEKSGKPNLALAKNNPAASPQADANNSTNNSDNRQTSTIDKNTTLPVSKDNNNNSNTASVDAAAGNMLTAENTNAVAAGKESTHIAAINANAAPVASDAKNSGALTTTTASGSKPGYNKKRVAVNTAAAANNNAPGESAIASAALLTTNTATAEKKKTTPQFSLSPTGRQRSSTKLPAPKPGAGTENNNEAVTVAYGDYTAANTKNKKASNLKTTLSKPTGKSRPGKSNSFTPQDNNREWGVANQLVSEKQKTWFERLTELKTTPELPSFDAAVAAGDSMATERETNQLLNTETKKAVARAQRDKAFEAADKKERKQLHLNLSNLFKPFSLHLDTDPWWAAGLSLNSGVSLNSQNRFNYNVNAKKGVLLDYIPSPYLQFHLNNYVYLQTELNLITPQYTPQLLLYRNNSEITAQSGMSQQKSIYIQKMYYFNWPVSLHYSPISNLYFQLASSSLLSRADWLP